MLLCQTQNDNYTERWIRLANGRGLYYRIMKRWDTDGRIYGSKGVIEDHVGVFVSRTPTLHQHPGRVGDLCGIFFISSLLMFLFYHKHKLMCYLNILAYFIRLNCNIHFRNCVLDLYNILIKISHVTPYSRKTHIGALYFSRSARTTAQSSSRQKHTFSHADTLYTCIDTKMILIYLYYNIS